MTIYNINRPEKFFHALSQCKGTVELTGEGGEHVTFTGTMDYSSFFQTFRNTLSRIVMKFNCKDDCLLLLNYTVGMHCNK